MNHNKIKMMVAGDWILMHVYYFNVNYRLVHCIIGRKRYIYTHHRNKYKQGEELDITWKVPRRISFIHFESNE